MPPHKWEPNTLLFMRANPDVQGCVTGYIARLGCPIQYLVTWGNDGEERAHWEGELTDERVFGAGAEDA